MRNIALRLRYDGSRYHGWQVQKNDISVCSTVQDALSKICEHPVKLTGCGRTDAGVHALRYCASFSPLEQSISSKSCHLSDIHISIPYLLY